MFCLCILSLNWGFLRLKKGGGGAFIRVGTFNRTFVVFPLQICIKYFYHNISTEYISYVWLENVESLQKNIAEDKTLKK